MRSMRLLLFLSCCLLGEHPGFAEKENDNDSYDGRDAWKSLEDFENEAVEVLMVGGRLVSGRLADVTETFVLVQARTHTTGWIGTKCTGSLTSGPPHGKETPFVEPRSASAALDFSVIGTLIQVTVTPCGHPWEWSPSRLLVQ